MSQISRGTKAAGGTTFQDGTTAYGSEVETDVNTLFNAHNNHDSGSSKWVVVNAEGSTTVPLSTNNSTGTQNIFEAKDNGTVVFSVADGGTTTITATNGGTSKALVVNNGTSTGNIIELQDNGTAKLTLADAGALTLTGPTGTSAKTLVVNNSTATGNIMELQDNGSAVATVADGGVATFSVQLIGKGTATNDSPTAGYIGEVMSASNSGNTSYPSSGVYGDAASLALTAGDWMISAQVRTNLNGSSVTLLEMGVSTTSGNSATGLVQGDNYLPWSGGTLVSGPCTTVANYHVQLASTTTHYLKVAATYTVATPIYIYRINAVRIR